MLSEQLGLDIEARQPPSRDDCLYAAGFFDGEGCVNLCPNSNKPPTVRAQMLLGNTDLPVLEWLRDRWGGAIYRKRDTIQRRPQWTWTLSEKWMPAFLEDIAPFVMVKAPAVDNARAFLRLRQQRRGKRRLTPQERAEYLPFLEAHRALNLDLRPHVLRRRMRNVG